MVQRLLWRIRCGLSTPSFSGCPAKRAFLCPVRIWLLSDAQRLAVVLHCPGFVFHLPFVLWWCLCHQLQFFGSPKAVNRQIAAFPLGNQVFVELREMLYAAFGFA
jgi:hypothetical protein